MGDHMLHELKQYLRHKGGSCVCEYRYINQARWDCNELQLVVPQEYTLEMMCGAHNDVGHPSLEWMLNILWDQFYWPNL